MDMKNYNPINCLRWVLKELGYSVRSKDTDHVYGPTFEPEKPNPSSAFEAKGRELKIPIRSVQEGDHLEENERLVAFWGLSRYRGFAEMYYYDFHVALLMEDGTWQHKAGILVPPTSCDFQEVNLDYDQESPLFFAIRKRTL